MLGFHRDGQKMNKVPSAENLQVVPCCQYEQNSFSRWGEDFLFYINTYLLKKDANTELDMNKTQTGDGDCK